jgi:hypothetical protein
VGFRPEQGASLKVDLRELDSVAKLVRAAPGRYRQLLQQANLAEGRYQLVSFGSDRKDVVASGHVRGVLERFADRPAVRIVALARTFTAESVALLRDRNAFYFELSEF